VCGYIGEEIPNIIHKSNEALDIIAISWSAPLPDMGHLVSVDMNSILVDCMTKAVNLVSIQVAFDPFEEELVLPQFFKYETKMFFMLLYGIRVDKYIV